MSTKGTLTDRLAELAIDWAAQAARAEAESERLRDELDARLEQSPVSMAAELRAEYGHRIGQLRSQAARDYARSEAAASSGCLAVSPEDLTNPDFAQAYGPLLSEAIKTGRYVNDENLGAGLLEDD